MADTTLAELQAQLEALKDTYSDMTAERLSLIQAQLARLEASYGSFARTYYNMFYNTSPMDITISVYDGKGALQEITVPNRAKSYQQVLTGHGSPIGEQTGPLGSLYIDMADGGSLWYKTSADGSSTGWCEVYTTSNWKKGQEYIAPDGDGSMLQNLNANNITTGVLAVSRGGTGVSSFKVTDGYSPEGSLMAIVPESTDDQGKVTPAYFRAAVPGIDYLAAQNLSGMIVYFPCSVAPAGYFACDGRVLKKTAYPELYAVLSTKVEGSDTPNFPDVEISVAERVNFPAGDYDDYFKIPNLSGITIRCSSLREDDNQEGQWGRRVYTYEKGSVPNVKGTWAQEITGAEKSFTGAIQIAKKDGVPVQVDGKTSAPAGAYDYLINFNAKEYSDIYSDDVSEVRVNNISLLPAIKI